MKPQGDRLVRDAPPPVWAKDNVMNWYLGQGSVCLCSEEISPEKCKGARLSRRIRNEPSRGAVFFVLRSRREEEKTQRQRWRIRGKFIQLRTRMEKYLKPERLELDPSKPEAADTRRHWKMTFNIFLEAVCETQPPTSMTDRWKLKLLINFLSPAFFKHISDIHDYSTAMNVLEEIFVKPKNSVFGWHLLATRRQPTDESVDQYLQSLKRLAKDSDFQAVTATQARDEYIWDTFINGITFNHIRQRLLENKTLVYDQALTLEMAQRQLASYSQQNSLTASVSTVRTEETDGCISVCDE